MSPALCLIFRNHSEEVSHNGEVVLKSTLILSLIVTIKHNWLPELQEAPWETDLPCCTMMNVIIRWIHDAENGIYIKQCTPVIVHEALRDVWIITFHLGKVEFLIMRWKIWQTIWQQCSPEKTPPHWYNIKMSWICDFHQINMLWL